MADKVSRADVVELLRVPVVAIVNAVQRTVSLLLDQVIVAFASRLLPLSFANAQASGSPTSSSSATRCPVENYDGC